MGGIDRPGEDAPRDDVREAYGRWAPTYDSIANATRDLDEVQLRADLSDVALGNVLELGSGKVMGLVR